MEEEFGGEEEVTTTTTSEEEEEGEAEEISVNVLLLEAMLDRLNVLERLARGEIAEEEARKELSAISVPETEKKRRRRK